MTLRQDFANYWDGNGLGTPAPCIPVPNQKGSDNGTMYTSEYYIILKKNSQLTDQDKLDFQQKIGQCVDQQGMLNRVPINQSDGQDEVDNYYGTLNGCMQLGNTTIPRQFLWALIKNLGSMNNVNPGVFQWIAFLPRQPQLIACMIAASFPSWKNPFHVLLRALCSPLFSLASVIIATSCIWTDASNTDARRLSWHLWQCLKPVSPLCWLASKVWLWRLYSDYGPTGMKAIASLYYQPQPANPYSIWWITK